VVDEALDKLVHSLPNGSALYQVSILGKIEGIRPLALGDDFCTQPFCSTDSNRLPLRLSCTTISRSVQSRAK
jgi:hypothetical protein